MSSFLQGGEAFLAAIGAIALLGLAIFLFNWHGASVGMPLSNATTNARGPRHD